MASSVSSERAFSSGGLTVTQQRNLLQGDIVEALQVLKAALRNGLLLREPGPSTKTEEALSDEGYGTESEAEGAARGTAAGAPAHTRAEFSLVLDFVEDDFMDLDDDETDTE